MKELLYIDQYTFQARIQPVLITIIPIFFLFLSLFPINNLGWGIVISFLSFFGIFNLISQFARDLGKRKEKEIFPTSKDYLTTHYFSFSKSIFNKIELKKYHEIMKNLSNSGKDLDENFEIEEVEKANDIYIYWANILKEYTRDKIKFELVFAENLNYGFRRNLFGLKCIGRIICILSIFLHYFLNSFLNKFDLCDFFNIFTTFDATDYIFIIITITFFILWFFISKNWVIEAAKNYAKRLIASCKRIKE